MSALTYAVIDDSDSPPRFQITAVAELCPQAPSRTQGELAAQIWAALVVDACCRSSGKAAQRAESFRFHHQADEALSLDCFDELARMAELPGEAFPDVKALRLRAKLRFGRTPVEAVLVLTDDLAELCRQPPKTLIAAGLPVFALSSAGTLAASAAKPLSLTIEASDDDNFMCALSLEDAAKYLKHPVVWDRSRPDRSALRFTNALLARGTGAILSVEGPTAEAAAAVIDTLTAAADILPRRIDAARMAAAEGLAKEKALGAPF